MSHSFRIRFNPSPRDAINTQSNEIVWEIPGLPGPLRLHNPEAGGAIVDAKRLVLTGSGYSSEGEALRTGQDFNDALMLSLVRCRIGADFGTRSPKSHVTDHGLAMFERQLSRRTLNNVHGLMVFETDPPPKFISASADPVRCMNEQIFSSAFLKLSLLKPKLAEREKLAITLFNSSFFRQSSDSRLLLLMIAIESLLVPRPRPENERAHVANLIEKTRTSDLPPKARSSMISALKWLENESISQAGRSLCEERLADRTYRGMSPSKYFTRCYSLRSALVHGGDPYPSFQQVSEEAATLEVFVSDLITSPFLGNPNLREW